MPHSGLHRFRHELILEKKGGVVFVVQIHVLGNKVGLGHPDDHLHSGLSQEGKLHLILVTVQEEHGHLVPDIVQGLHEDVVGG